ncbi:MAG: hypothetical protein KGD58_10400 [Candidatus Lokiarchaeota archaeon]|nr:hypothetical protein [Candidatus Lokiarchaeota archaeon]
MDLSSVFSEIKQLLSISDENFDLEQGLNHYCNAEPEENKLEIIGDILNFVNKFSLFQDNKPFMNSLYTCITNTLEIKPENIYDYEEILVKNTIMFFLQKYMNYSKITPENQVLEFLTDSLEKLETQPLITNLGLLIKPMYQDQSYISNLNTNQEVLVSYETNNGDETQIKSEIDSWLKNQEISLDNQEKLIDKLLQELNRLFAKCNLSKDSEKSKKLNLEAIEMLNMKLTMLSLMEQIPDDSFEPIPIK